MIKKYCPNCHQSSYSSCEGGTWVCPTCANDLSREPVLPLNYASEWKLKFNGIKPEHLRIKERHLTLIHNR